MDKNKDSFMLANVIAEEIKKLRPLDRNLVAMMTAQLISDGKDRCELNEVIHFLQLIILALKTYCD